MGKGQILYQKAKKLIPGGTQLLSKRPEQFLPDYWPSYYSKAKGCYVWDLDEKKYIDMSYMGIGSCVLGYSDDDVNNAVIQTIQDGNMSTLNVPEEVELAELMLKIHPWANMVRYARGGGEAMAIAIRIARAATKKDIVLFCGYHGWHDWYLSANLADDKALDGQLLPGLSPIGVPRQLKGTSFPFSYNNADQFIELFNKYKENIGAIVVEAIRNIYPQDNFFSTIQEIANKNNIPIIVDEVSSGFRINSGGAHLVLGLNPDIAVFAKAVSNGYPMGIIIGKSKYMDVAQDTFISSTYWTERIGPVAALATVNKIIKENVPKHLVSCGEQVQNGWRSLALKNNIDIEVGGIYPLSHFNFKEQHLLSKTLYTQEMLKMGFLATNAFYASFAHKQEHIDQYLEATDIAFKKIHEAQKNNNFEKYLDGPVCQSGFRRLT